jgi:hypothetical protein
MGGLEQVTLIGLGLVILLESSMASRLYDS